MLLLARVCFRKLWLSVSDVCMGVFLAHLALYIYTLLSRSVITQLLFNYKYNVSFVYFIVHQHMHKYINISLRFSPYVGYVTVLKLMLLLLVLFGGRRGGETKQLYNSTNSVCLSRSLVSSVSSLYQFVVIVYIAYCRLYMYMYIFIIRFSM